jgi:hypothetical protein
VVSFIVFGLFIFSPSFGNWWQSSLGEWYQQYLIWLVLIGLCYWIHRSTREKIPKG